MEPQIGLFMPILLGTDGKVKMSKSIGNYVGLNEPADVMYHKIYSLADSIVENWFELLTNIPLAEIKQMMADIAAGKMNPNDAKHRLAIDIVTQYYGAEAAEAAAAKEREIHSGNAIPSDAAECSVAAGTYGALDLLVEIKAFASKGEARRMVQNGGVKIAGEKLADPQSQIEIKGGDQLVVQVGKRKFFKVNF
jgi:tyrosyl-tRNA synthetase